MNQLTQTGGIGSIYHFFIRSIQKLILILTFLKFYDCAS